MIRRIKKIIKLPLVLFIKVYFRIRQFYPFWFYFLNRRPRKLYQKKPPNLNEVQERVVKSLRESGIAIVNLDEIFPGENKLALLQAYTRELRRKAEAKTGKTFLEYLWEVIPVLDFENPFVRISLDEKILDIVNAYLEMWARFYYLTLNITIPVKAGEKAFASQRWHRDPEDKKMLKLFIYLNDVDDGAGPFIYIPYSKYGLKWGHVFPQKPPRGFYPPEGAVEKIIPPDAIKYNTGRAGTVIFCDTTGLHKGGYALEKERIMFTAGYRSTVSAWYTDFKYPRNLEEEMKKANLNQKARFALKFNSTPYSTRLLYWLKGNK